MATLLTAAPSHTLKISASVSVSYSYKTTTHLQHSSLYWTNQSTGSSNSRMEKLQHRLLQGHQASRDSDFIAAITPTAPPLPKQVQHCSQSPRPTDDLPQAGLPCVSPSTLWSTYSADSSSPLHLQAEYQCIRRTDHPKDITLMIL